MKRGSRDSNVTALQRCAFQSQVVKPHQPSATDKGNGPLQSTGHKNINIGVMPIII
jgi:hypothetical protein